MNSLTDFFFRNKKWIKRIVFALILLPVLVFGLLVAILYTKQDYFVGLALEKANADFNGKIEIGGSHIAPFANFPNISIDLEHLKIYESKADSAACLLHLKDTYLGFDLTKLLSGEVTVKKIKLSDGTIDIRQHKDGSFNLANALASKVPSDEVSEDLHLSLESIELDHVDISKLNESTNLAVDLLIKKAKSSFHSNKKGIDFKLDSDLKLSIIQYKDTTFFNNKHLEFDTEFTYLNDGSVLKFKETSLAFEKTLLDFKGKLHLTKNVFVDLQLKGHKPDFNLFLSVAPPALSAALKDFDNRGKIYFNASIKGNTANGQQPAIIAHFGCKEGLLENTLTHKKMKEIAFNGSFTNGTKRDVSTMEFILKGFHVRPELGVFNADLSVRNFSTPEIDMRIDSELDLAFLGKFSNARELKNMGGKVALEMRFHDIIDLNHPELAVRRLNEAYYSKLKIEDFHANFKELPHAIKHLNLEAVANGHQVDIKQFHINYGASDLSLHGYLSDLPALLHHTDIPIELALDVKANHLNFADFSTDVNANEKTAEQLDKVHFKFKANSSAKAMIESQNLPRGEFAIRDFQGKFNHYPHRLHDLNLAVHVDDTDLLLKELRGFADHSDLNMTAKVHHYDFWFKPTLNGEASVTIGLNSNQLFLKELFYYAGHNHLPKEYQREEVSNLTYQGHATLGFHHGELTKATVLTDKLSAKLKSHPLALHHFSGGLIWHADKLDFSHLKGALGDSDFELNGAYHLNDPTHRNSIRFKSKQLNVDSFLAHAEPSTTPIEGSAHDKVLSLYDYEFPNLDVTLDVGHLIYAPYDVKNLHVDAHVYSDHHMELNHLRLQTAEGSMSGSGTFSGRDKKHIYFSPHLTIHHLNLDKFMVKFDDFGQDHLVSENLHGYVEGTLSGKIHMHADFVPKLDDSELKMNLTVINGRLENYAPLVDLGTYFEDKNVSSVAFDTLKNNFTLKNGVMTIPEMLIASSLGYLKISGTQEIIGKMKLDYQVGIPWQMIKDVAKNKLSRDKDPKESSNDIITAAEDSKYLYFKVKGDLDNFEVKLIKRKK